MEGPMNIDPAPVETEQAAQGEPEAVKEPADLLPDAITDVGPGSAVHFPTHQPRLTAGGQKVFQALRPAR